MDTFSCSAHDSGNAVVVTVTGDIDLASCDALAAVAGAHVIPGARVVLDCSGITFLDSSGLSALAGLLHRADAVGARLVLAEPSDPVLRTLQLSGTRDRFEILPGPHRDPVGRSVPRRAAVGASAGKEVRHVRGRAGRDQHRG